MLSQKRSQIIIDPFHYLSFPLNLRPKSVCLNDLIVSLPLLLFRFLSCFVTPSHADLYSVVSLVYTYFSSSAILWFSSSLLCAFLSLSLSNLAIRSPKCSISLDPSARSRLSILQSDSPAHLCWLYTCPEDPLSHLSGPSVCS